MTLKIRLYLAGIALLSLSSAVAYIYHAGGERALLKAHLHASDSTIQALTSRAHTVDTIYRRDTVRYRLAAKRYDSIVTRWETTTVAAPPETVQVIVAEGQKALNVCSAVVLTCEQRVAQRDSIISALRAQRPLLLGNKPSKLARIAKAVPPVLIAGGAGYLWGRQHK